MTQTRKTYAERLNGALDEMEIAWRNYAVKKSNPRLLLRYVRSLRRVERLMAIVRGRGEAVAA